jgi:hypothetical protein
MITVITVTHDIDMVTCDYKDRHRLAYQPEAGCMTQDCIDWPDWRDMITSQGDHRTPM